VSQQFDSPENLRMAVDYIANFENRGCGILNSQTGSSRSQDFGVFASSMAVLNIGADREHLTEVHEQS
jgi:hypothetical protein